MGGMYVMYGVRMTPAHPWYVGRGDDKCGGNVVYSIQDIRQLLRVQPEDVKRWLTTRQMGWALTREENEVVNEKDEREGKPVARQLAPMISTFIRAQWESEEMENVDDERRQILEEAMELDHIWGVWEEEKEWTNAPRSRRPLSSSVQVEAQLGSGVRNRGRQSFCGRAWAKKDEKNVRRRFASTEIG